MESIDKGDSRSKYQTNIHIVFEVKKAVTLHKARASLFSKDLFGMQIANFRLCFFLPPYYTEFPV